MNLNEYDSNIIEEPETGAAVEYVRPDVGIENRYVPDSVVSIKGRQDIRGKIDRIDGKNVIVKIMGETYSVPPSQFDSLFFVHPHKSPENWYAKKSLSWGETV